MVKFMNQHSFELLLRLGYLLPEHMTSRMSMLALPGTNDDEDVVDFSIGAFESTSSSNHDNSHQVIE